MVSFYALSIQFYVLVSCHVIVKLEKDAESSLVEPERVANYIWNAHTDSCSYSSSRTAMATRAWAKLHSEYEASVHLAVTSTLPIIRLVP